MSVVLAVMGIGMTLLGRWGWRQPGPLAADDRTDLAQRRAAALRRGGGLALVFGLLLLAGAVVSVVRQ